jgi:hypothetical protein
MFSMTAGECWRHIAQRQARHRPHLLRELAGDAGVDGVVAAVVRTRGHLVDDQRAVRQHEEFDAQHADVTEFGDDRARRVLRLGQRTRATRSGPARWW